MAREPAKKALGLVALALLWAIGTLREVGPIEADLTSRAAAALGGAGLDGPALLVAGRDVAISGAASSASGRQGAIDAVAGVWGVRKVDAELVWIKLGASAAPAAPRAAPAAGADFLSYDFSFLWPWLLPAAILGVALARALTGGAGASARQGPRLALSSGSAAIAFALGLVAAAIRWPPGRPGFWLEAGSLFLAVYFAGKSFSRLRVSGERFVR